MKDTIIRLKEKPEHVRRRIAVATSAGITALVAIVWVGTMASSGAFALGSQPAGSDASQKTPDSFALSGTNVQSNFSQLMGAVSAATGASSSQPSLTIVDGGTSSSFDATTTNPSATVIPF